MLSLRNKSQNKPLKLQKMIDRNLSEFTGFF